MIIPGRLQDESDLSALDMIINCLPAWLKDGHELRKCLQMGPTNFKALEILLKHPSNPNARLGPELGGLSLLEYALDW